MALRLQPVARKMKYFLWTSIVQVRDGTVSCVMFSVLYLCYPPLGIPAYLPDFHHEESASSLDTARSLHPLSLQDGESVFLSSN